MCSRPASRRSVNWWARLGRLGRGGSGSETPRRATSGRHFGVSPGRSSEVIAGRRPTTPAPARSAAQLRPSQRTLPRAFRLQRLGTRPSDLLWPKGRSATLVGMPPARRRGAPVEVCVSAPRPGVSSVVASWAWGPRLGAELSRHGPRGVANQVARLVAGDVAIGGDHDTDGPYGLPIRIEDGARQRALAEHGLVLLDGDAGRPDHVQLLAKLVGGGDRLAGHAAQLSRGQHSLLILGEEGEQGLAQSACMGRDDNAHLRHLAAAVGAWLMVDDHDVVDEQHAGAHGKSGAPGEVLGPGDCL